MNLKKNTSYGAGINDYGSNLNTPMGMISNPSSMGLGTYGGTGSQSNFGASSANYVTNQSIGGGDDTASLKRKIQMLEAENKQLKEASSLGDSFKKKPIVQNDERNWMSSI